MASYRMSVAATIYFWVEADDESEALRKAREVDCAIPSPLDVAFDHEHIEVGDLEVYPNHDEIGPEIEDVEDDPDWMKDGGRE